MQGLDPHHPCGSLTDVMKTSEHRYCDGLSSLSASLDSRASSKLELGAGLCAASKRTSGERAELDSGQRRSQRGAAGTAVGALREPVTAR